MLALPWSPLGCPPLCIALPDQVSPRASKLACRPVLTNTGWLSRRGAAGTAADDEEEEEDDEKITLREGGRVHVIGGGCAPRERLVDGGMLEKTPGRDDSTALASQGRFVPEPLGEGGVTPGSGPGSEGLPAASAFRGDGGDSDDAQPPAAGLVAGGCGSFCGGTRTEISVNRGFFAQIM